MRLTIDLDDGTGASRPLTIDADDTATVGAVATEIAVGLRLFDVKNPTVAVVGRPSQPLATDLPVAIADLRSGDRVELREGKAGGGDADVGAATLVMEAGPEAGRRIELGPGRHYLGRGGRSTLVVDDPTLSRVHLSLRVGDGIEIADEGSTNGVKVDGRVIGSAITLRPGQKVAAGDTLFRVEKQSGAMATAAKGTIPFNRPPRVWAPFVGSEVELPAPIGPKPKQRIPKIAALFPLLMALVMKLMGGNMQAMVFMLMSPIMMFGSVFEGRMGSAKDHAGEVDGFRRDLKDTEERLERLTEEERTSRELEWPSVGELAQLVEQTQSRLWERSPDDVDFLDLRLGVGELPLRTTVKWSPPPRAMPELVAACQAVADKYSELRSAPVTAELKKVGSLGIAGSQIEAESLTRSLILQMGALHSPADLVVAALFGPRMQQRWEWLMWLPHIASAASPLTANHLPADLDGAHELLDALAQLVDKRRSTLSSYGAGSATHERPAIVLLIDESVPLDRARINWLFQLPPTLGVYVIWLGSSVARMPKGCGVVADVQGGGLPGTAGWTGSGKKVPSVRFEGVPPEPAIRVARRLTPIVDVTAGAAGGGALPPSIGLIDLLGNRELLRDAAPMIQNWKTTTSIGGPIGRTGSSDFSIDMRLDGPHALVAGTTGAGKSELLQTLIASLASLHSPERVTFLLVDYKGGSAFAKCVEFPHTVGLVTDLDTNQVRRALVSLNAELHHREKLLERHRVKDLIDLEKKSPAEAPPSLLIIVDEFAALAKEIPEFVDGVVNVAQRGRSLGLHLILATQRPAGVITDNIRANTNLRIALRVADPSESNDVIGTPFAASLSRTTPGRGVAKVGPQELVTFQTGYVGGHSPVEKGEAAIRIADVGFGTLKPWPRRESQTVSGPDDPNDLSRLVSTANSAMKMLGLPAPRRPWLAPLQSAVNLFELPRSESDTAIVLGLQDNPSRQAQSPGVWLPEKDGSLAIFGSGGAGKSTTLWTIAASASSAANNPPPIVYALDFAGRSMEAISELPNVGSVIAADDHERVVRLLSMLRSTIAVRSEAFAAVKAADLSAYRRLAPALAANMSRTFVLIDGYGNFLSTYERIERGVWSDLVPKLMADGRQVGVHFVITADRRGSIPNSTYSLIPQRIVLRLSNDDEYGSVGAPYKVLNNDSPEGRALFDGLEMQIAVAGGSQRSDEQAAALRKLGAQLRRQRPEYQAPAIGVLPEEVTRYALASTAGPGAFAVSGTTLEPVRFEFSDGVFLVAGPMRSGKSSAIATLGEVLRVQHPERVLLFCAGRRSSVASMPCWSHTSIGVDECTEAIKTLGADLLNEEVAYPPVVFIDDFNELHEGEVGQAVSALLKVAREVSVGVVASSDSAAARRASQYTVLGELRQHKHGLLLAPDLLNSDGDILGATLPNSNMKTWPAGRGYVVRRGGVELVQIGLPA